MFLLVWYYCTLTIRESILKVNGSRIKGWWRAHHFISTVVSAVLLIWPNSTTWYIFRPQFMIFNVYISQYNLILFLMNNFSSILKNNFSSNFFFFLILSSVQMPIISNSKYHNYTVCPDIQ